MKINQTGLQIIKDSESLYLKSYLCPANVWTIGWGHTRNVRSNMTCTKQQAEQWLQEDLTLFEQIVDKSVKVRLNDDQFSALVGLVFNIGGNAFASSTLLKLLNNSDYQGASNQFERWVKGNNNSVLPGLVKRRKLEKELFMKSGNNVSKYPELELIITNKLEVNIKQAKPELVKEIQSILGINADGIVGDQTLTTLANFKAKQNLGYPELIGAGTAEKLKLIQSDSPIDIKLGSDLASRIIKYMQSQGYKIFTSTGEFNIVYVEGINPDGTLNNDAPNVFNDLRCVIEFKDGVPSFVGWLATSEPGRTYTVRPMNVNGAARIKFGQYKAWSVGMHGTKNPHEALVQVAPVTVHRDKNKDFTRTGDKEDTGLFGINQHWAADSPVDNIGAWSAGCLVGRTSEGHREFMRIIKSDVRYKANRNYVFWTTVIDGSKI